MKGQAKGSFFLLITAMVWGTGFIGQKLGMDIMAPMAFNGVRQLIASIAMLPLSYFSWQSERASFEASGTPLLKGQRRVRRVRLIRGGLICGFILTLGTNFQQYGLQLLSAGKSGFITSIYIILVPILGIFAGNKIKKALWGCVVLALVGFAMLSLRLEGGLSVGMGDILTLISAFFFALHIIVADRQVTRSNAILLSNIQLGVCGILTLILSAIFELPRYGFHGFATVALLYCGLVPTAVGYTFQMLGQKSTDPTVASLLMSLEAVFASLFGVLLLHERMSLLEWSGCAVIFGATLLSQLVTRERPPKPELRESETEK